MFLMLRTLNKYFLDINFLLIIIITIVGKFVLVDEAERAHLSIVV